ncbi:MAG: Na+/H+ antiporter NhaA [Chitinophagaceae bacterium]|nr:Na+/H+ antiporter NhaA [Chitinophagaceae bacterium]
MKFNPSVFKKFFSSEAAGGIVLILLVACSLLIANSSWSNDFENLLSTQLGFQNDAIQLRYSLLLWINDGLMAVFFLLVGLEIKRELVEGELASRKKALLPVFAAFGGAIVPAIIYSFFNNNSATSAGWGIPMATDIAFALGALSLLGKKVPPSLKIFLAALAIVDDLIAILVIAIFYSSNIHLDMLLYGGVIFAAMVVMNRLHVKRLVFYLVPGIFLWYFIHHSGIHATIAGVLTALTIPTTKDATVSPLEKLEHALAYPVNFVIMPIFALANTNITFESGMTSGLFSELGLGIMIGLFIGKPVGITLTTWIVVKLGWGKMLRGATWAHIIGLGLLGGIGFTMSIFIALLSFDDPLLQAESKFSVLVTSVISGFVGFLLLNRINARNRLKASA